MQLEKMTAKNLREWVSRCEKSLQQAKDDKNIALFTKWLNEARAEQERRLNNKLLYLRRLKNYDKN